MQQLSPIEKEGKTLDSKEYNQAGAESGPSNAWRSLDELEGSPAFQELLRREFATPPDAQAFLGSTRRDFLRLLGGTLGLAGLAGCVRQPREKIVPYINQPEHLIPGKPIYYATALEFAGFGRGVVVETHEYRPTKVEGNTLHPASLGATSLFEQAAILDLYDPARSSAVLKRGELSAWEEFIDELQAALSKLPPNGAGLHILTGAIASPVFGDQWHNLLQRFPAARWHQYEPVHRDAEFEGATRAFGRFVEPQYHFGKARVAISFGADFLFAMPGSVRYARDWVTARDVRGAQTSMNRLYVLESAPTITGAYADDRRAVSPDGPDGMTGHAAALAAKLGVSVSTPGWTPGRDAEAWAARVAGDLHGSRSILIAGSAQPPELHTLVHAMNAALGNFSTETGPITFTDPIEVAPVNQAASLQALADAMRIGSVQVLLLLGGNWAQTAPADLEFDAAIRRVPFTVHLGLYRDETAEAAAWHIPQAHPFESWADIRAFDGTASIVQPLIEPLFDGRTLHELMDCVAQFPGRKAYDIQRDYWLVQGRLQTPAEDSWRRALHDGVIAGTAAAPRTETLSLSEAVVLKEPSAPKPPEKAPPVAEVNLIFAPDSGVWDGRFSQNAWLQELPRPITRLSWENAFLIAPSTAGREKLATGDVVRLRARDGRSIEGAVFIQPGMAEGVLSLTLGCGSRPEPSHSWRSTGLGDAWKEETGKNVGIDAYPIRTSREPWRRWVTLEKTGERHEPVSVQHHHLMEGRDMVRTATISELPKLLQEKPGGPPPTFYDLTQTRTDGIAWAMSIDLTRCIGCNACVAACQSENNIPPVGRAEVAKGREMLWIRIDAYFLGDPNRPAIAFQPVPCMHCETAPCELVCPVDATLHDHEGLNLQVYNRCIGTRYCSNNCPYKVRRFNFFPYAKLDVHEPLFLMHNPNVTVRQRGVMEKCTYCLQRITAARIRAEEENRPIQDGDVIPACAQACPTQAILFGNRNDPKSQVAGLGRNPLNYSVLGDQNTRPRTTYLMQFKNPV